MKRFTKILLIFISLLILVSCTGYIETNEYESNDEFETKIIETSSLIKDTVVSFESEGKLISQATIISSLKIGSEYKYYAITINHVLKEHNNITVYINELNKNIKFETIFKDEKYNIAAVTFNSKYKLNTAKVKENDKFNKTYIGQTILTIGTDSRKDNRNNVKEGIVTKTNLNYEDNNISNYFFTHDAAVNYGEKGSPIYDLNGYLVGINIFKTYFLQTPKVKENVLGLNDAINVYKISSLINNIEDISKVDLSLTLEHKESSKTELEERVNSLYNNISSSVVKIQSSTSLYSGLVYNKEGKEYKILTASMDSDNNLEVLINNKSYEVKSVNNIGNNELISELVIETSDELNVYSNNLLNNGINDNLLHGQYLISIGSFDSSYNNLLSFGSLSKDDYQDDVFMHDLKLNGGQIGAPIFNLNGNLVGIHLNKINHITTNTGIIAAEGLSYSYNLNSLNVNKTLTNYESNINHEKKILKVINDVNDAVVTVRTNSGHGSGVVFKKEAQKNGKNIYYVLTNEHVLTNASEIYLDFNNELSIYAKDYQVSFLHDMGVIRFESSSDIKVVNSKVIENKEGIKYSIGQRVIAIGTPESKKNNNYVTTGIIKGSLTSYDGVAKLGVHHDAALNPGNSGGPLFDLEGNLIGLNVAKMTSYTTTELGNVFSERLSISLNINTVAEVFNFQFKIFNYEELGERAARLGVTVVSIEDLLKQRDEAREQGLDNYYDLYEEFIPKVNEGVLITEVDKSYGSYGLLFEFDVIVEINGISVKTNDDVAGELVGAKFGDKHIIKVIRVVDGQEETVTEEIELI